MRKIWACLVVLAVSLPLHANQTVRIATSADSPPYSFACTSSSGVCGFEVDLFNAICAQMSLDCSWQIVEWKDSADRTIFDKLLASDSTFDAIVASVNASPERRTQMLFSASYYAPKYLFVGKSGQTIQFNAQEFPANDQPLKIGSWAGFLLEELNAAYPNGLGQIQIVETNDPIQAIKDGTIDLAYVWTGIETALIQDPSYKIYGTPLDGVVTDPFGVTGAATRISAQGRQIEEAFSLGLVKVRQSGVYKTLAMQWVGQDIWDCKLGPQINDSACAHRF